jgi:cytochrome b
MTIHTLSPRTATVRVWDLAVRLFHWSLVASLLTAYFSTEHIGWVHKGAGYLALALVTFRVVWGFVAANPYARFAQFVPGPGRLAAYLAALRRGQEPRHLGHNPAGAVMIVYLLLATLTIAISGWMMTTDAWWGNETVETVHTLTVEVSVWAVALHVTAALITGLRHRENLILAMITGRKRRD